MARANSKLLESDVKNPVIRYTRKNGLIAINLRLFNTRGIPDTLFIGPGAQIMFIEFKRPGATPRELQKRVIAKLKGWGFHVIVCDNEAEGKKAIKTYFNLKA